MGKKEKKYFLLGRPNLNLTKDKFSSWLGSFLFVMCFRPWLSNFSCIFFAHFFLSPSLPRQAPLCIWPCYLQSSIQCGEPRLMSLKFGQLKRKQKNASVFFAAPSVSQTFCLESIFFNAFYIPLLAQRPILQTQVWHVRLCSAKKIQELAVWLSFAHTLQV